MREEPIYVVASDHRHASIFVARELHSDVRRLRWIDRADRLRGMSDGHLLYILPCAGRLRDYFDIMGLAEYRGFIIAKVDDSHARRRYEHQQGPILWHVNPPKPFL